MAFISILEILTLKIRIAVAEEGHSLQQNKLPLLAYPSLSFDPSSKNILMCFKRGFELL